MAFNLVPNEGACGAHFTLKLVLDACKVTQRTVVL